MDLKKLFGFGASEDARAGQWGALFDEMAVIFKGEDETTVKFVTGFAGLLGKIAYADLAVSDAEKARIRAILLANLDLIPEKADLILRLLDQQHAQLFSIEDYFYQRLLNDVCDRAQKKTLIHALFQVAAADASVSAEEDAAIWTAAKGLKLSHREFIDVRAQFKAHLDVLKS
ncbi:MAG: TerB family tellurite resistance protein [Myxococcota bacterium]|nr:TerB family tellurite resistance protein [Myxococcota bacterium]